jgi:hypothetical protein
MGGYWMYYLTSITKTWTGGRPVARRSRRRYAFSARTMIAIFRTTTAVAKSP